MEQSPLRAIVPPSKDSVSVDISLPGKKVEGEEIKAGPPVIASEGHEIDARRRAPEPRPGASVPLSFNDPKAAEIVEPNFIFPDHAKPDMRPWLPTFTEKWYTFDNPIDNNLVRGASFVVFLTAIMIFIFGMKTCEECHEGYKPSCDLCPKHKGGPWDTPYVWYMQLVIWYDFFIRTCFGMTVLSPFAIIANFFLKIFGVHPEMAPSSAKRFSFFLGIVLNTVLFTLHFGIHHDLRKGPLLVLIVFSALESVGGFCVGCWFFGTFFRMKNRWELRMDYRKDALKESNPARPTLAEHRTVKSPIFPLEVRDWGNEEGHGYMYDLVVIGGGSGGLSASKEAARLGQKVAVLDYVKPTPYGSRWGIGGTCVNVGCIPKKLYHTAAICGHNLHEAGFFGWDRQNCKGEQESANGHGHSWERLRENIQGHISQLNNGYITGLRSAQVQYINARGSFVDAHTILCDATCPSCGCEPQKTTITARRILIAVGGRPQYPDIPGARELCITSDDIFSLERAPGKTLVVGASYIALECGGFLTGLGYDVSVMVRSQVLRGFDRDAATRIKDDMIATGTRFIEKCTPVKVEAAAGGKRRVTYQHGDTKEEFVEEFDTVLFAIGRTPVTEELKLDKVGVKTAPDGKIWTWNERTSAPHVYAVGDVAHGVPELTPVAVKQGLMLAKRLYGRSKDFVNLEHVPTTVFTPLEYGSIGFSEEKAIEVFGEKNIEVYHSEFTPLEYTVPHRQSKCYAKIIVNYLDGERVIGFHYLGPNAGEVTQGFAGGFIAGLQLPQWNLIVGIHPTCAEEMVSLRRTKRSGLDPKKTGC